MPRSAFEQTPLEEVYKNDTFASSKHVATHLSDGLRAALVYKVCEKHFIYFTPTKLLLSPRMQYGGWYADTDFVFIKSMRGMQDVVTATGISAKVWT